MIWIFSIVKIVYLRFKSISNKVWKDWSPKTIKWARRIINFWYCGMIMIYSIWILRSYSKSSIMLIQISRIFKFIIFNKRPKNKIRYSWSIVLTYQFITTLHQSYWTTWLFRISIWTIYWISIKGPSNNWRVMISINFRSSRVNWQIFFEYSFSFKEFCSESFLS